MAAPSFIFVTLDPEGRVVGLDRGAWHVHIQPNHPEVTVEMIRETIERPEMIWRNEVHGSLNYLRAMDVGTRFYLVSVKKLRDAEPQFLVATAYADATPPSGRGALIWHP
jgi:hypothetical protein